MGWLQPAIIASIATSLIITLTYIYIYTQYRQINFLLWTIAWLFSIARFVTILIMVKYESTLFTQIINELFSLYNAVFLVMGVTYLLNKKYNRLWILISIPISIWVVIATILKLPFFSYTLPAYLFSGIIFIRSGVFFIRQFKIKGRFNNLVGVTLILHGLHKFDYPFLRTVQSFVSYGFLINSLLTLIVSFGFVLLFYEKEHLELTEKESLLSSLFSQSPLAIILSDKQGNIITVNDKFTELLGYTCSDVNTPELWFNKAYPDAQYREYVMKEFENAVGNLEYNDHPPAKTFEVSDKGGSVHILEFHFTLVLEKILFILNDLTEKKKMEDEILNNRKLESLGVLAGGIAHDFNNMLTGISGNIELAAMNTPSESEIHQYLENSQKAVERATALTSQLLTFSKRNITQTEIFNIRDIIQEATQLVLSGSNISALIEIDQDLWYINANKGQISQVINNLIINAMQAMPQSGHICINAINTIEKNNEWIPDGEYIKIDITDEGRGIPENIIHKIFDPYFTTKKTGTGLGLASCYSIITNFKGKIICRNNIKGCTFTIYLPAIKDQKSTKQAIEKNLDIDSKLTFSVLIVDDDKNILSLLDKYLSAHGFQVYCVTDGNQASKIIDSNKNIDLVLTDLTIPGKMGGMELMEYIRKSSKKIPVILMSGYAELDDIDVLFKKGFKDFLQKPFQLSKVMEVIHKTLTQI